MKSLKLIPLLLAFHFQICAQNLYVFTKSNAAYSNITGGTVQSSLIYEDFIKVIQLPFTFRFAGGAFDIVTINEYGDIDFSGDGEYFFSSIGSSLRHRGIDQSYVTTKAEGTTGSRIFKIEYKNIGFDLGVPSDFCNFQIWLYENTNTIEIRYGGSSISNMGNVFSGENGPYIRLFRYSIPNIYLGYLSGNSSNPTFTEINQDNESTLSGYPSDGTVFRFAPSTTGINEINELHSFSFFPMPANDVLYVKSQIQGNYSFELFDVIGQSFFKKSFSGEVAVLTNEFPVGVYIATVTDSNGRRISKSILINH